MKKFIISSATILLFAVCASAPSEGRVIDAQGYRVPRVTVIARCTVL